jgi:hypothetical protein
LLSPAARRIFPESGNHGSGIQLSGGGVSLTDSRVHLTVNASGVETATVEQSTIRCI